MSIEFNLVPAEVLNAVDLNGKHDWPSDTWAIVAAEDGRVIGHTAILNLPCIEGTKVIDEKVGSTLAYRLMQKVEELYLTLDKPSALALVSDTQPEIADYLCRTGYELVPVKLYVKTLVAKEKVA